MWKGGVRIILLDDEKRILMVSHSHEGKEIWMVPGGGIEEGENSMEAAAREMLEETGLEVQIGELVWHVEEVSKDRGQRFVNFFMATYISGKAELGIDPEFDDDNQVLMKLGFFTKEQLGDLPIVYPNYLKDEIWDILEGKTTSIFKIRTE